MAKVTPTRVLAPTLVVVITVLATMDPLPPTKMHTITAMPMAVITTPTPMGASITTLDPAESGK